MGIDTVKRAIAHRIMNWCRIYNSDYDMAVFVNDHIGSAVINSGQYEREYLEMTVPVMLELMPGEILKDGICLDVGANIGNHSLFYSKIFREVVAFEPNPIAYKLLEANVLKNRISNIKICTTGLGSKKEKKSLSIYSGNLGMSSLVENKNLNQETFVLEVETNSGDELLTELVSVKSKILFIKIDVEGFEAEALLGLQLTIQRHQPIIAIELNFFTMLAQANDALRVLRSFGYQHFYMLKSAHTINNGLLNFTSRVIFGEKFILCKIEKFEMKNYQQIYCVAETSTGSN